MTGPDEDDRTIIRPAPGGRARPSAAAAPSAEPPATGVDDLGLGAGPLLAAASPLLSLLARLAGRTSPPAGGDLRTRAIAELAAFEREAQAAGVEPALLARARALLAAALDDAVLATPWGSAGAWAARPMLATLGLGEDRFFEILREASGAPAANTELLELGHLLLSLGYAGRFRNSTRAAATLDRVRTDLHAILAGIAPAPARLAPRAGGAAVPLAASRVRLPVWVAAIGAGAIAGAAVLLASLDGQARTDRLVAAMLAAPPAHMPAIARSARVAPEPVVVPDQPSAAAQLRAMLDGAGLARRVRVAGTEAAPVLVIDDRDLFGAGATLSRQGTALLASLGHGLAGRRLTVLGTADPHGPHPAGLRSPFALATSRARAVARDLATAMGQGAPLLAEGREAADPDPALPAARIELVPGAG